jgi:hypothetical protein
MIESDTLVANDWNQSQLISDLLENFRSGPRVRSTSERGDLERMIFCHGEGYLGLKQRKTEI